MRYSGGEIVLLSHAFSCTLQMISTVAVLVLIGVVAGSAPSYHQERPSREQLAQWEADLGMSDINNRLQFAIDPELEDVVDPTLLNELEPGRAVRDSNHPLFQK